MLLIHIRKEQLESYDGNKIGISECCCMHEDDDLLLLDKGKKGKLYLFLAKKLMRLVLFGRKNSTMKTNQMYV